MVVEKAVAEKIVEGLSPAQRQAVLSDARYLRIVASAGAGKTETITRRIIYLLAKGEEASSIVAFTFTDRAAKEMKERIYRREESILGPEYCKEIGEMYIGTIHGFAMRLLQDRFGYGNYDVLDENQEVAFLMRHGWTLGLNRNAKLGKLVSSWNYSESCQIFLKSANVVYDELIDIEKLSAETPDFAQEFQKYEKKLDQNKLLTFGRMIKLAVDKVKLSPQVISDCKHLIVDEYQDINKAQERLIKLLAEKASCYVVGDPRQCIYQWRGSDPGCFERFATEFKAVTIDILENRRSGKNIVQVGNNVGEALKEPALRSSMTAVRAEDGTTLLVNHDTNTTEAQWLAEQIEQLVNKGVCEYQDIAILLRSVSTSGPEIIDQLRQRKIPYLVGGRVGLFKRDEAQAVGRIFAWCGEMPWQEQWQPQVQDEQLLDLAVSLWPGRASKAKLQVFKDKVRRGAFKNFTEAYQELLVMLGFLDWDPLDPQTAARMANLGRFNTLLTDFESSKRRGSAKPNWETDLKDLAWFMNTYASGAYEEQPAEDLQGQPAVQVTTVHQAKGLEWPVVFIPALSSRRFPSSGGRSATQWFIPDALFDRMRYEGGHNEERKLFYVAVTRARDGLCLSYFSRTPAQSASPSPFLEGLGLRAQSALSSPFINSINRKAADEEEIVTYSTSEIIEYLRCPYFYRLRNIWGYQAGLAELIGYGKSLHQVLRVLCEKAKAGEDPLQTLDAALDADFHLPYASPGIKKLRQESARGELQNWIKNHMADLRATEEIEARLEFQLTKKATVSGRVDVILSPGGERELRDYKTANDPQDDQRTLDEAALQLRIYALGLKDIGQDIARASIARVTEKDKAKQLSPVEIINGKLDEARVEASSAITGILSGDFNGRRCTFCGGCDYRAICGFA